MEEVILTKYVPLNDIDIAAIRHMFLRVVIPVMTKEHASEDGRSGAVLNLRDNTNTTLLNMRGGIAPEEKFLGYAVNAAAKNDALDSHPHHWASWLVHKGDTSKKPYPGAIRTHYDDRISISGFTWQRDTIGSLWIACKLGRLTIISAVQIAETCGIRQQFIRTATELNGIRLVMAAAA